MLDIDRNVNSLVYEVTSGDYINNLSPTTDNFKTVHSINIKQVSSWKITLDPGKYYYKHILYPVESGNSLIFVSVYSEIYSFPVHTYYAQSTLKEGSPFTVIIPWHFVINNPTTFTISVNNITNANLTLSSLIEISKRVK